MLLYICANNLSKTMKKVFGLLMCTFILCNGFAQVKIKDIFKKKTASANPLGAFTEAEAGQGIKDALSNGIANAVLRLNKTDGFFKDELYKILLPEDARKAEKTLRKVGFGPQIDKAILQINRGAEDAAGAAKPIFVDAIKSMSITDAIGLIKKGDTSATNFFRNKTTQQLTAAFLPIITASLDKAEASKYYGDLATKYNSIPLVKNKITTNLAAYVTNRAIATMFDLIAKEERNIRTNFAARTTDILKKVFGGK
jgi:hypothetical protein